jgi:hypothetical protein
MDWGASISVGHERRAGGALRETVPRVGTVIPVRDSHSQCRQMNNE